MRLAEEEAEAARHKSGGKTKPKPADDTMKFVSEESSSEPEQVRVRHHSIIPLCM